MTRARVDVVVVGGGFSGVATTTHLLRRGVRVAIVEPHPEALGRGVAYGVSSPVFRLNVPASKMSLDPAVPDDFVRFAGAVATPNAFLPRAVYGDYVAARFREAAEGAGVDAVHVVAGRAARVDEDAVALDDGRRVTGRSIVLATGLVRPELPPVPPGLDVVDAWDEAALEKVPMNADVLVVGSGLTALDVVALLRARGFGGRVTLLSRRGVLPAPHLSPLRASTPLGPDRLDAAPRELRGLVAWVRGVVREAEARGEPWQLGIDALRPHVTTLWRRLSPADRVRFVRSVRPFWDAVRHRAPADALSVVSDWRASGKLVLARGSMASWLRAPSGTRRFATVILASGPEVFGSVARSPLLSNLVATGRARSDAAGLGIDVDERGRVLPSIGQPDSRLFAIGALRQASSWETTSVPDIAPAAVALATELAR